MSNANCTRGAWVALCAMLLFPGILPGQSTLSTGAVRGTVTDPAGAAVAGAEVVIRNQATASLLRVKSLSTGMYSSGPLQPGDYTLRVTATGFKPIDVSVEVQVAVVSNGNVRLQKVQESEVAKEAPTTVNTDQPTVQTVLSPALLTALPVSSRNYLELAQFAPGFQLQDGVVLSPGKSGLASPSVEARYGRNVRIEVDGTDISDETVGAPTQNISASAIQEFNVASSFLDLPTELTSSGAVNISTRSGSNGLHGEAFGLFRGDQVAASLPGSAASRFQREHFGGRADGAFLPDKLFWFLSAERVKQDWTAHPVFASPFNALATTVNEPFRDLMADGRLDWQGSHNSHGFYRFAFDEVSQIRPFGAFSSLQVLNNALHTPSHTLGYDFSKGRYAHSVRFEFLRMSDGVRDLSGTIPAGNANPVPGLGINIGAPVQGNCALSSGGSFCGGPSPFAPQATIQSNYEVKYDGSRMMASHLFRFGATLNRIHAGGFTASFLSPQVGTTNICLPGSTTLNCLTSSSPTDYPAEFVSLGNGVGFSTPRSAFGYPGGELGPDNRIEAYAGDVWKVKHNLTLTYGVRYLRDEARVDNNLGPEASLNLWQPGLGGRVRNPNLDLAPQFGFAWDSGGNGKTVIRGGAGLYYENNLWTNMLADSRARRAQGTFSYTPQVCSFGLPASFTWPTNPGAVGASVAGGAGTVVAGANQVQPTFCGATISSVASDIQALSSAFQAATAANAGTQPNPNYVATTLSAANANGLDVFDPNYRTPRSWQMNLGFQHSVRPGTILAADFIRNVGEHYLLAIDRNHSGAARSYNQAYAAAARDAAQLAHGCGVGYNQATCMVLALGKAGAQAAYSAAGLDSNTAVTGSAPCSFCAFPGVTPNGQNTTGSVAGNGALGTLDMLEPIGRSVYQGIQVRLLQNVQHEWYGVKASTFQIAYAYSKYVSQALDQDVVNLAVNNDRPLQFTGPNALDRKHQLSVAANFELPFFTRVGLIGRLYSPLPQTLELPQLTNGGEIFATDWLGSGLGSGAAPQPLPGTNIGQFMRGTDASSLQNVISNYNTHSAGTLTPAGHCLIADGLCPGLAPVPVMTTADMNALGWVMPQIASVAPGATNFPWLKSLDLKASWPIRLRERLTIEPSVSLFNVGNFSNAFLPGNLALASLLPGGPNNTLAPNSVGGVTGASLNPFRAGFQSGTYALGAPRQLEFGLHISF